MPFFLHGKLVTHTSGSPVRKRATPDQADSESYNKFCVYFNTKNGLLAKDTCDISSAI